MSRFSSFQYAPSETRQILRDRFARKLRVSRQDRYLDPNLAYTPDVVALRLLQEMTISPASSWSAVEAAYGLDGVCPDEATTLPDLVSSGGARVVWGRVKISRDIAVRAFRAPDGEMDALKALVKGIHSQTFGFGSDFGADFGADAELRALSEDIVAGQLDPHHLVVRSPTWVAERLWEAVRAQAISVKDALRRWFDLWGVLKYPDIVPERAWGPGDAAAFREVALGLIGSEPALAGWIETRDLYVRQAAFAHNVTVANAECDIPAPPSTAVCRALWLEGRAVEGHAYESLDDCADLFGLARVLLADVDAQHNAKAPHPMGAALFDLALDRPELFNSVLHQARSHPRLLADLVLHPPTAALACLLIAQWRHTGGAWERSLTKADHQVGQADAFADGVAILGEHLRREAIPVGEAAALLTWLHRRAGPGFVDDGEGEDLLMARLRRELADCPAPVLLAMTRFLRGSAFDQGLGAPEFAAVLDLCDLGNLTDDVDPERVIAAYEGSLQADHYSLSAYRVGVAGAAALARLSERTEDLRRRFLYPLRLRARLADAPPDHNPFMLADALGRSVRAHIRILCRAIVGGPRDTTSDLLDALVAAVRSGALEHKEKGRVAAFAPSFESTLIGTPRDRPLASDLTAALGRLNLAAQVALLDAILQTDEPLILAQILPNVPPNLRARVEQRIAALAPDAAAEIRSLPEMQARIDQLLTVGAADAAASYMAAEKNLKTWGKPAGRELTQFRNGLRLAFLRQDWDAITQAPQPAFTAQLEQESALETLQQFRGLVALVGPNRDPAMAKAVFANLFAKRNSLIFATNWFAAAICELLVDDGFSLLSGPDVRLGRQVLAELDRMVALLPEAPTDEVLECNRAQLLLALGEPSQALATLSIVPLTRLYASAAAYRAVAFARLGQPAEATAALDGAEFRFGVTPILAAARAHIASGAAFLALPDVSAYDDLVDNVGSAIARFRLMGPQQQARVLRPQSDAFEALLIDYVRAAADAVVSLVPMMKSVDIDAIEDDLNAFVQHLLAARVQFLGWSVNDQSKGGYSAKANAGERDIILTSGSTILAIIEALKCKSALTRDVVRADLESHFQKLLGYGTPRIFFHLTYAYIDVGKVIAFLETAAKTACPPGFKYLDQEKIRHEDSRPPGFVARYDADFGEVKVVFLVLNMGQHRQRNAGITAGKTKARKATTRAGKSKAMKPS
ncbi:hypothetical protein HLH44_16880 [Gluconacetobacter sp. 1c LMG 22058]|uniref:Uncharacterized protein n=1 Tax=Gluconacetobacter dulcium TaxID=2729096 RepID=A0A7W4PJZ8_9PROT|nr:hypothetical protein [Gluconacetobacter dulcium]MBB2199104.1 hypothetical protein [Gluconacetobacter dulcium]